MMSIHFNFELFLIGVIIMVFLNALGLTYFGLMNKPKSSHFSIGDGIAGIIYIIFIFICLIF